jgi:hypothetical protein
VGNAIRFHLQSGFFFKLTPGGLADILAPFHMSAGNTPHARVRSGPSHQKQMIVFNQHNRHPDRRVAVLYLAAVTAI